MSTHSSLKGKTGFPKSYGDSRDDLGYGRLHPKFHVQKLQGDPTFPYVEEPTELDDDVDVDIESIASVHKKLQEPRDYDPLSFAEPFYFAGGSTKLGEASGRSISPMPGLYKGREVAGGGAVSRYPHGPTDGFSPRVRPTGDRYGYSTMYDEDEDADDPAYTLEDIAEKQLEELRHYIRYVLLETT